jgi:transposase
MATKYIVTLTADERAQLERMVSTGKRAAQALIHARILLKADVGDGEPFENERIARAVETSVGTVYRVRQLFVEEGMDAALYRKPPKRHYDRKLDGEKEARLVAIACSKPPEGRVRWTMQLLAEKLIELKIVDTISDDTVHRTLKKTKLSRG